jgi:hypothetical protein
MHDELSAAARGSQDTSAATAPRLTRCWNAAAEEDDCKRAATATSSGPALNREIKAHRNEETAADTPPNPRQVL